MKEMLKKILVVEDDEEIRDFIIKLLRDNDYAPVGVGDGAAALKTFDKYLPDLVILDLGLPKVSGETVCLEIKKNYPQVPVILLTAQAQSADILYGFKLGADDYIAKPFVGAELLARIKARFGSAGDDGLKIGDLELSTKTFEVKRGGKVIPLTQKEFELLHYLMINKGRVLTREMILNKVWLYSPDIESRVVDVYIGYLRKKIDGKHKKKLIHSSRGFGYSLKEE